MELGTLNGGLFWILVNIVGEIIVNISYSRSLVVYTNYKTKWSYVSNAGRKTSSMCVAQTLTHGISYNSYRAVTYEIFPNKWLRDLNTLNTYCFDELNLDGNQKFRQGKRDLG